MEAIYGWQCVYAHLYVYMFNFFPSPLNSVCSPGRCFYMVFSLRQLVLLGGHPGAGLAAPLPMESCLGAQIHFEILKSPLKQIFSPSTSR